MAVIDLLMFWLSVKTSQLEAIRANFNKVLKSLSSIYLVLAKTSTPYHAIVKNSFPYDSKMVITISGAKKLKYQLK